MNYGQGIAFDKIKKRIRACDYLCVAQLFLQNNFLLNRPLTFNDIKPRLLGHWGSCHGINVAYTNLQMFFSQNPNFSFVLGPGHGFPALQANLFIDGDLEKINSHCTRDLFGIAYLCRQFSWPGGFPSHASPLTPGVICEGGELGYALANAYGAVLGHPEKTIAVLIGDGEFETATALDSLNLVKLVGGHKRNGKVWPFLHLNGYKISAPTLSGRKDKKELHQLIQGFGYTPIEIDNDSPETFQKALKKGQMVDYPFYILRTLKGATGPVRLNDQKIKGNYLAHQIPLPNAKTDLHELNVLEHWLRSYRFYEVFQPEKGFLL